MILLLVPALELGPHVELEVRPFLVVDEAALVEPCLEVGVVQEALLRTDVVDDAAQVGIPCRNAQVILLLVPALELGPHVELEVLP